MTRLCVTVGLIVCMLLVACGGPQGSASSAAGVGSEPATPSASAAATTSALPSAAASAEPTGEPSPTSSGTASGPFGFSQRLEVTADGLAVRRGPTTSAELAFGAPWDADAGDWLPTTEAVRLPAGYQLLVLLGPVTRDGFDWYEVRNLDGPGTEPEVVQWDADGDRVYADSGWIAAGDGDATFVEAVTPSDPAPNPPLVFAAGGSGTFVSDPFQASGDVGGTWVLVTGDLAPCDFTVVLEPSDAQLAGTSLIGVYEYGSLGGTGLDGEYRLRVTAGVAGNADAACNWALALFQSVS